MAWLDEPLETKRLLLRAANDDDLEVIVRMLTDPAVRGYLGGPVPEDRARAALSGPLGERWGSFLVTRMNDGEVVGSCLLERERGELEISYQLLPEHWGHGYAREAVTRVLQWAWDNTEDASVIAVTQTANAASMRLLEVIGMDIETQFEEHGAHQTQFRLSRPGSERDDSKARQS